MIFGTKAETLERLEPLLHTARVLPQIRFTAGEWRTNSESILESLRQQEWSDGPLAVRSSALGEDSESASQAGKYTSVIGVRGNTEIQSAVEKVFDSYGRANPADQAFIQPCISQVSVSGVAFSRDPNTGGPYLVVNYDDRSGTTDSITSGGAAESKIFYCHHDAPETPSGFLGRIRDLIFELIEHTGESWLDIEFAIDSQGSLILLQVRPLPVSREIALSDREHTTAVTRIHGKVTRSMQPHPYLRGAGTILGVMPDWNPAEIIGIRPKPLAFSLYRELITDSIWAYQRNNYGYLNLRSFPLLVDLEGLPYVDCRVSFNSFVPQTVSRDGAERLVDYYLNRLREEPQLHDKVEFGIVQSCYTFDLDRRFEAMRTRGISEPDIEDLEEQLRLLTERIIDAEKGHWRTDAEKIERLEKRQTTIMESGMDIVSTIYWLMEDCKRYGTLPFAGLARAGFIATQMLDSMTIVGILTPDDRHAFAGSLQSVATGMLTDFHRLSKATFLARYGHLRPGTYDILSARYDETPDVYFDWSQASQSEPQDKPRFSLTLEQMHAIEDMLHEHHLDLTVLDLFDFIKSSIEGREYAKFVFTRSVSNMLSLYSGNSRTIWDIPARIARMPIFGSCTISIIPAPIHLNY